MIITLKRKESEKNRTIGEMFVNGEFRWFTLEDVVRAEKIRGMTAIPFGQYVIQVTFSPRFNCLMPLVCNVPGFDGVRIHEGNTESDTEGCILVGRSVNAAGLVGSRPAYRELLAMLIDADKRGESNRIDIVKA